MFVPFATLQNWVEAGEKKAHKRMDSEFLDWALADFSGYVAADELYHGPFCICPLWIIAVRICKKL